MWQFFSSIRFRLALILSAILAAVVLALAAFMYVRWNRAMQQLLVAEVDSRTDLVWAELVGWGQIALLGGLEATDQNLAPEQEFLDRHADDLYLVFVGFDSGQVVRSDNLRGYQIPLLSDLTPQALTERPVYGVRSLLSTPEGKQVPVYLEVRAMPGMGGPPVGALAVGKSLVPVEQERRQILLNLGLFALAAAVASGVAAVALVGRGLRPVQDICRTARRISSQDLSERIRYRGPLDEVGVLAWTFDEMLERLERAFTAQGRFVANASHELRTPLSLLAGYTDYVLRRTNPAAEQRKYLEIMKGEVSRLTQLVNDLLELSRADGGSKLLSEPLYLDDLIVQVVEGYSAQATSGRVQLGVLAPAQVQGDATRLAQALRHVVDNAFQAGARVVTVSLAKDQRWATTQVADNGPGIPPEELEHLFDQFYRWDLARDRARGGSGLELALVRAVVERHGGQVWAESTLGQGSCFFLRLPVTDHQSQAVTV